ncbi:sugar transferase [Robiginitalea aurantiaca]|uniref:Sugar transferase n=1 Tax=Robiginitalea aurantiaca TaxID=3056915 RepID=A0ABT7WIP4_9FLAO|nr:sugar transferase [Robiginitalea aurantiaca]MDM9632787.1 sugar transferase [Robiginitalea aurantiaca]
MKSIYPFVKRTLDAFTAAILLILLSPIILLLFLLLSIANNGSPIFYQRRPGKDEKIFTICKFKTMTDKTDQDGNLLPDGQRVTRIGSFIRKTSLDEIPQLFNVLKGDMSFVGPRPLLVRYLPYYTPKEKIRHSVRPGISGLAQVSVERNVLKWDQRFRLDIEYVENISFLLDLKILFWTFLKVIRPKDVIVDPTVVLPALDVERKSQMA